MSESELLFNNDQGVFTLTLNRPERLNAITSAMFADELPRIFGEVRYDDKVKVLIITGAGTAFCSGIDVRSVGNRREEEKDMSEVKQIALRAEEVAKLVKSLKNIEKPVIAAINGVAVGAGISLALHSDIRIASENARFSFAFVHRGIIPDTGATFALPRLIGTSRALELMITGDMVSAQEAERIGLVNRVLPQDKFIQTVQEYALRIAHGPSVAISLIKKATYEGLLNSLDVQLEYEVRSNAMCHRTFDYKEGVKAFLKKGSPILSENRVEPQPGNSSLWFS